MCGLFLIVIFKYAFICITNTGRHIRTKNNHLALHSKHSQTPWEHCTGTSWQQYILYSYFQFKYYYLVYWWWFPCFYAYSCPAPHQVAKRECPFGRWEYQVIPRKAESLNVDHIWWRVWRVPCSLHVNILKKKSRIVADSNALHTPFRPKTTLYFFPGGS